VLALPIASIAWTVTHEEVFREPREWCAARSHDCRWLALRKFFYLFTCEFCFSHWVTAFFLFVTRFTLLYSGWRGYLVAGFALVWIANFYMSLFGRLRLEIREERAEIAVKEKEAEAKGPSDLAHVQFADGENRLVMGPHQRRVLSSDRSGTEDSASRQMAR
jgi:hypothetical protein